MKQRAVAIVADYLSHRLLGRVVGLKPVGDDDYVLAIEDLRDTGPHREDAKGSGTVAEVVQDR